MRIVINYVSLSCLVVWGMFCCVSCGNKPSAVEQRKSEIREMDSLELLQARVDLAEIDSLVVFKTFEWQDLRDEFVFEKQERYQTKGYYVLPAYQGDKSRFNVFPEVEENGTLLLVTIDKMRKYTFTEIDVHDDYQSQLPENLSGQVRKDLEKCGELARVMQDLDNARKQQQKQTLKVRFYERKMSGK